MKEKDGLSKNEVYDKLRMDPNFRQEVALSLERASMDDQGLLMKLSDSYHEIINILNNYLDISEDHKTIATLWILGTWFHKEFNSYPYLFINAMKGSGKTRFLKLIESLCYNGKLTNNMSEAVLFRTAENHTILIDEFEGVGGKNANVLRELLNSAYKKGAKVERMKKVKTKEGEQQKVEEFNLYTPVAMANIWGMNEVLGDRCLALILDKSSCPRVTSLIENFDDDEVIQYFRSQLSVYLVKLCSYFAKNSIQQKWNYYVNTKHTTTYTTYNTYNTHTTFNLTSEEIEFFEKISDLNINGRYLELFFPLFIIARSIDPGVVKDILHIASNYIKEKKTDETLESRDVSLLHFIAKKEPLPFYSVLELTKEFKMFFQGEESEEDRWLNSKWLGRALKRLNLVLEKRRMSHGIEVRLKINEANKRVKMFKEVDNEEGNKEG